MMKLTVHSLILITVLSLAAVFPAFGQENSCAFTLKEAQRLYQQGLIEKIPALLFPCLQGGFSRQERQEAYKLIMLCYLFDDNQKAADSAMLQFLKKYPEYEINPTDPKEFVFLFDTYKNLPVFGIGVIGGLTVPQFFITQSNSTNNQNGNERRYKNSGTSYQMGIQMNTYLADHYELGLGIAYSSCSFKTIDNIFLFGTPNETRTYNEVQSRLEIPIFVRYNYPLGKKIVPYARLGFMPSYTLSANANVSRIYYTATATDNSASMNILKMRNLFGISALGGIGIKYRIPRGFLFLDIKYQAGLSSQLRKSYITSQLSQSPGTTADPDIGKLVWSYSTLTDNFRLNELTFSVGYSFSFYHPKKKTNTL